MMGYNRALPRFIAILSLASVLPITARAGLFDRGQARVLVDSWAREGYLEAKVADGEILRETYHFFEGRHFGGNVKDKSLEDVSFLEVVESLAEEMETRNYHSESNPEDGDFLIVVHWGVTGIEEPLDELFVNQPGDPGFQTQEVIADTSQGVGSQDFSTDFQDTYQSFDGSGPSGSDRENAALIGFDRALNRKGLMPTDESELRSMLEDERYFIILMAYDWQKLRLEKEYELVWSTRFSLNAIGTNFRDAHLALSRGASNYFGTNLDGKLGKTKTHLGEGEVKLGDVEVVETVDEDENSAQ